MFEHRCMATNVNGTRCARRSITAWWCHRFEGWSSGLYAIDGPSWWETCTQHDSHAQEIVASMDVRRYGQ